MQDMEIEGLQWWGREWNMKGWESTKERMSWTDSLVVKKDNGGNKQLMFIPVQNLHLNIFTYDVNDGGLFAGKLGSRKKGRDILE